MSEAAYIRQMANRFGKLGRKKDPNVDELDTTISGVKCRVYSPNSSKKSEKRPVLIYFHGGGFCFGVCVILINA